MKKLISKILVVGMALLSISTSASAAVDHNGGRHNGGGRNGGGYQSGYNGGGHNGGGYQNGHNGGGHGLCGYSGCNIAGDHQHGGVTYSGHYEGDGHGSHFGCDVGGCILTGNHSHHSGSIGGHYSRCNFPDCNITGNHQHDGVDYSGHYSGDGHDHHFNYHNYPACIEAGCTLVGMHEHNGINYCRNNFAAKFTDVPARVGSTSPAWYYEAVDALTGLEVVTGTGDYSFSPDANVRRSEFTKFLFSLAEVMGKEPQQISDVPFTDMPGDGYWATGYIGWAYENDIVKGHGNGKFSPNEFITRQDISVMMENFITGYLGIEPEGTNNLTFTDQNQISPYASQAVAFMTRCGLMQGHGGGVFAPQEYTPRCQAAQLLYNCLNKIS